MPNLFSEDLTPGQKELIDALIQPGLTQGTYYDTPRWFAGSSLERLHAAQGESTEYERAMELEIREAVLDNPGGPLGDFAIYRGLERLGFVEAVPEGNGYNFIASKKGLGALGLGYLTKVDRPRANPRPTTWPSNR
ncbi:hypothetical protein A3K63_04360 [Candidatus Micrarchaeota archaeon RBG_16_49_10]|nr:MAG: hypothetical protein A3K63_04360 [Candidatus Micrarchaeota archaeon RBG_16_49_10]